MFGGNAGSANSKPLKPNGTMSAAAVACTGGNVAMPVNSTAAEAKPASDRVR
jgi:hypothetical protein